MRVPGQCAYHLGDTVKHQNNLDYILDERDFFARPPTSSLLPERRWRIVTRQSAATPAGTPSATGINGALVSDGLVVALVWLGIIAHAAAGVTSWRRGSPLPLLPIVNLATALCVVAYAGQRWFTYIFRGITWYGTDQLLPAAALGVCILSVVSLTGRYHGTTVHWVVFAVDATVFVAAAVFFATFRMDRLF